MDTNILMQQSEKFMDRGKIVRI